PQGATGATGQQGPQGATGPQGAPGANGSQILRGNGTPGTSLRSVGDYYIDNETSNLYGPKPANGWGNNPINLSGTANVAGTEWIDVTWDADQGWQKSFEHVVPNPVLNAVDVPSIQWLNDNGGVVLMYFRAAPGPNAPTEFWQWQIPSMINNYWDMDVRWSLVSATPNTVVVTAPSMNSHTPVDISNSQFRYVVIPPGQTISLQARGLSFDDLSFDQALDLIKNH